MFCTSLCLLGIDQIRRLDNSSKFRNGLIYGIYCISSWLAPALVTSLGPRMAMMMAATTYLVQASVLMKNKLHLSYFLLSLMADFFLFEIHVGVSIPIPEHNISLHRRNLAWFRRSRPLDSSGIVHLLSLKT